jgi:hypothetical protein
MTHDLTLWGTGTARTMRAHWMLLELGLEYEFHPVQPRTGETLRDDFLRINPRHKIPVLRHGPRVLTESAAEPAPGQVRVRVQACGVCHSDAMTKDGAWPGICLSALSRS